MVGDDHGCSVGGCLVLVVEDGETRSVGSSLSGSSDHVIWVASLSEVVGQGFALACKVLLVRAEAANTSKLADWNIVDAVSGVTGCVVKVCVGMSGL